MKLILFMRTLCEPRISNQIKQCPAKANGNTESNLAPTLASAPAPAPAPTPHSLGSFQEDILKMQ